MAVKLIQGNKKMYLITVEGLSYLSMTDNVVDFTVEFYTQGKYSTAKVSIKKSEVHWVYDNDEQGQQMDWSNTFHCLCDTKNLPTGKLACDITITYPDADTLDSQGNPHDADYTDPATGKVVPKTVYLNETITCTPTEVTTIATR